MIPGYMRPLAERKPPEPSCMQAIMERMYFDILKYYFLHAARITPQFLPLDNDPVGQLAIQALQLPLQADKKASLIGSRNSTTPPRSDDSHELPVLSRHGMHVTVYSTRACACTHLRSWAALKAFVILNNVPRGFNCQSIPSCTFLLCH